MCFVRFENNKYECFLSTYLRLSHGSYPQIVQNLPELAYVVCHYREVAVSGRKHQSVGPDAVQPKLRTESFFLSMATERPATSILTIHRSRRNSQLLPINCRWYIYAINVEFSTNTDTRTRQKFRLSSINRDPVHFLYLYTVDTSKISPNNVPIPVFQYCGMIELIFRWWKLFSERYRMLLHHYRCITDVSTWYVDYVRSLENRCTK
jgi:hypothetical protein